MAANQGITTLADVRPFKTNWKIQVKIVHSWTQYMQFTGETTEMILADQAGTLIHATVKKQQVNKLQRYIQTGEWRIVEHFTVAKSTGKYRATKHGFKISLMNTTVISRIPSISEEIYLDLANFPDILNEAGLNENILIDVLGQVVSCGEMKTHDVNNKATKRLECELRDTNDERLPCTLWGRFAEALMNHCENAGNERVILLIRLAKINSFKGARSISNCFEMSLLEINPTYPIVEEFVANLPPDVFPLTIQEDLPKESKLVKKKEYYNRFPRKTISELFEATEVGKYNILCTIMNVDTDYAWYFFCCLKCSKTAYKIPKVENEIVKKGKKPMFWCPTCKEDTPKVVPRYLLNIAVMDNTGDTKCKVFDKNAQELIGVSAEDLLEGNWEEIQDPTNLPQPIKDLVGKTFQFLVTIGKDNITEIDDTYKVSTVLLGNDFNTIDNVEDSDLQIEQANELSIDQEGLALTGNSSETTDVTAVNTSTPSSKRSVDDCSEEGEGQGSTTKKPCVASIRDDIEKEKIQGDNEAGAK
ncbi:unnamed protein product [Arabidopsis halleri]